jgi:hypothetical protein
MSMSLTSQSVAVSDEGQTQLKTGETQTADERRRGLRISQERPVKVYDVAACRYVGGWTQDISSTGLRIALPLWTPLKPGSLLSVHVGLNRTGEPLVNRREMMTARVVWVDRAADPENRSLLAGVEFVVGIAVQRDAA